MTVLCARCGHDHGSTPCPQLEHQEDRMNTTPKTPLVLLADAADELHKLADRLTDAAEELLPETPTPAPLVLPTAFELPKPPTGHMVGGLITEGHAGQRLHADGPQS